MSGQIPTSDSFWRLLDAACDGNLAETQGQELAALLDSDPTLRKLFAHHVQLRTDISLLCRAERARDLGIARIQATRQAAASLPSPVLTSLGAAVHGTVGYISSGWPVAYLAATVIFGVGLLIGSHVYVSSPEQLARQSVPLPSPLSPFPSVVGQITGMVDCQWVQSPESRVQSPALDSRLSSLVSLGDKFTLASGLMEITYDTGAKVILQGPVTYEVESKDGGYLSLGRLTAKLERKAKGSNPQSLIPNPSLSTNHYPLFTLKTPTALVTDLGTEFGVEVNEEGDTTSHVFRGSVRLQEVSANGTAERVARVLHENQSARVTNSGSRGIAVLALFDKPANFIREMPKRTTKTFDLADAVAGGDGFSGRRSAWIDATTGRVTHTEPKPVRNAKDLFVGDGTYHRVESLGFVDGVFIPDGRGGPVQVDSAGHAFAGFPNTANRTSECLWAHGAMTVTKESAARAVLGGIDYALPGHSMLYMQSNMAVTFDLDAIRRASADHKLLQFRARAGKCEPKPETDDVGVADLWVLVDGQKRFGRREINSHNGAFAVVVPIRANDHFLTLASTDGGDDIWGDWIIFGDPRLELAPVSLSAGSASQAK